MSNPLLVAKDIVKGYRLGKKPIEVLQGVNLEIAERDYLAIHGASGAGKSTLLHLLGGLDAVDSGEVRFRKRNLCALNARELSFLRNREISFVFQAYHLFPEFTALENVCLPGKISRRQTVSLRNQASKLLQRVGLEDRLDHRPSELSGGEQQRVAIARALINDPSLLLADEPTGNLDSITGNDIISLLKELRRDFPVALVIATHDLDISTQAERVVHLTDGRIT